MSWVLGFAVVAVSFVSVPAALWASYPARPGELTLIVAPPWGRAGGPAAIADALSGRLVGPTDAPFAVLAIIEDPLHARALGAWAVLDGRSLAMICGIELTRGETG